MSKKKDKKGSKGRTSHAKLRLGSQVYIHAHHPSDDRSVYVCKASVIRCPEGRNDVYKVLITDVQYHPEWASRDRVNSLLGMKILRSFNQISTHLNKFVTSDSMKWTGLGENEANNQVSRAIKNIKKDRIEQSRGKRGWLITRQRKN